MLLRMPDANRFASRSVGDFHPVPVSSEWNKILVELLQGSSASHAAVADSPPCKSRQLLPCICVFRENTWRQSNSARDLWWEAVALLESTRGLVGARWKESWRTLCSPCVGASTLLSLKCYGTI